jgi:hypothetical protein
MTQRIRVATEQDVPELTRIRNTADPEHMYGEFNLPLETTWVGLSKTGTITGYVNLNNLSDHAPFSFSLPKECSTLDVLEIFVDSCHQRKSVGTKLLEKGIAEWSTECLFLTIRAQAPQNLQCWYEKKEFTPHKEKDGGMIMIFKNQNKQVKK